MAMLRTTAAAAGLLAATLAPAPAAAQDLDAVTFGTGWLAQAEQGGFYQAKATGIYERHGLDVTIVTGGPQVNMDQLLAVGEVDFNQGSNSFNALNAVEQGVPLITVAAIFQKEPRVLIAHPGVGHDSLADLVGEPIMLADSGVVTFFNFLKATFGYTDDQVRPYTFNLAPFLTDKEAIIQGFLSSEPYAIEQKGIDPVVMLLAEAGYDSYSTTIQTRVDLVEDDPDLVQRFVDASILGWYDYLNGDPSPGNALIMAANPDMTQGQIDYAIEKIKEYGIVQSGVALAMGIGAMTEDRWQAFFALMADQGIYPADLDWRAAFTTEFVNQRVGMAE